MIGMVAAIAALGTPARASTFQFATTGAAISDGRPENAQATFKIDANTIVIDLLNTAGPGQLGGISSTLSGVTFKLTGGAADDLVILSATAAGAVNCVGGPVVCPAAPLPSAPFGWSLTLSNGTYALLAGGGSLKPYALVNGNVVGNTDGMKNGPHNPYLLGPSSFTISFAGTAPTGIQSSVFYFGTNPADRLPGVPDSPGVPEPASLVLVGSALLAAGWQVRRKRKQQRTSCGARQRRPRGSFHHDLPSCRMRKMCPP